MNTGILQQFDYSLKPNKISLSARKPVYGVGINDADYKIRQEINEKNILCQFYKTWKGMIQRCYDHNSQVKQPTYIGCTVCNEWLKFSNFKRWMEKQDWQGKEIDKDILVCGNKVYSPNNCMFVPKKINGMLIDRGAARGKYPQGVFWKKDHNKFTATLSCYGKNRHLGYYDTIREAQIAYWKAKIDHIIDVANKQNETLRMALLNWIVQKVPELEKI